MKLDIGITKRDVGRFEMNERIRELVEQAEDWADNQNFYASDYRDYLMEKFAELIVRECARVGEQYADGNYEVPNQILENFGLEEE